MPTNYTVDSFSALNYRADSLARIIIVPDNPTLREEKLSISKKTTRKWNIHCTYVTQYMFVEFALAFCTHLSSDFLFSIFHASLSHPEEYVVLYHGVFNLDIRIHRNNICSYLRVYFMISLYHNIIRGCVARSRRRTFVKLLHSQVKSEKFFRKRNKIKKKTKSTNSNLLYASKCRSMCNIGIALNSISGIQIYIQKSIPTYILCI